MIIFCDHGRLYSDHVWTCQVLLLKCFSFLIYLFTFYMCYCPQCEKEFHVGCLKDHNMENLRVRILLQKAVAIFHVSYCQLLCYYA
jgi:hypothetical protein